MDLNLPGLLLNKLVDFSAISVATHYWKIPSTREKIRNYFREKITLIEESGLLIMDEEWYKIIRHVQQKFKSDNILPEILIDKVSDMIFHIGRKTFFWMSFVLKGLLVGLDLKNAMQICWTSFGNVDDVKIFQIYWQNDDNINRIPLYQWAVHFAQTKFIKNSLPNMIRLLKDLADKYNTKFSIDKLKVHGVMALFTSFELDNGFELYKEIKKMQMKSPESAFLINCLHNGITKAAKYFYSKIDDPEQDCPWALTMGLIKILQESESNNIRNYHVNEMYSECLFFVLNHLSPENRTSLLSDTKTVKGIYKIFITCYPHQKLCLPILKSLWQEISESKQKEIVDFVLNYTVSHPEIHQAADRVFPQIVSWIFNDLAIRMSLLDYLKPPYLEKLLKLNDFNSLDIILNCNKKHRLVADDIIVKTIASFSVKKEKPNENIE